MLSVIYAECHLCWVSFVLSVIYGECYLCLVSFILSIIHAKCHKIGVDAECHLAECRYAKCRGALKWTDNIFEFRADFFIFWC